MHVLKALRSPATKFVKFYLFCFLYLFKQDNALVFVEKQLRKSCWFGKPKFWPQAHLVLSGINLCPNICHLPARPGENPSGSMNLVTKIVQNNINYSLPHFLILLYNYVLPGGKENQMS